MTPVQEVKALLPKLMLTHAPQPDRVSNVKIRGDRKTVIGYTTWRLDGIREWIGCKPDGTVVAYSDEEAKLLDTLAMHWVVDQRDAAREAQWCAFGAEERAAMKARIAAEARRIVNANIGSGDLKRLGLNAKSLELVIRFRRAGNVSGRSWFNRRRVLVSLTPTTPWSEVQWLLTHELAHQVPETSPKGSGRKRIVHGPKWQEAFARIAERAHGVDCWAGVDHRVIWSRNRGVDLILREALKEHTQGVFPWCGRF